MDLDVIWKMISIVGERRTAIRTEASINSCSLELYWFPSSKYKSGIFYTKPASHDGTSKSPTALTVAISRPNEFTFDLILNIST